MMLENSIDSSSLISTRFLRHGSRILLRNHVGMLISDPKYCSPYTIPSDYNGWTVSAIIGNLCYVSSNSSIKCYKISDSWELLFFCDLFTVVPQSIPNGNSINRNSHYITSILPIPGKKLTSNHVIVIGTSHGFVVLLSANLSTCLGILLEDYPAAVNNICACSTANSTSAFASIMHRLVFALDDGCMLVLDVRPWLTSIEDVLDLRPDLNAEEARELVAQDRNEQGGGLLELFSQIQQQDTNAAIQHNGNRIEQSQTLMVGDRAVGGIAADDSDDEQDIRNSCDVGHHAHVGILVGGLDGNLKAWGGVGTQLRCLGSIGPGRRITCLVKKRRLVFCGCRDGSVVICRLPLYWRYGEGAVGRLEIVSVISAHAKSVTCMKSVGQWVYSGGADGNVVIWRLDKEFRTVEGYRKRQIFEKEHAVSSLALLRDRDQFAQIESTCDWTHLERLRIVGVVATSGKGEISVLEPDWQLAAASCKILDPWDETAMRRHRLQRFAANSNSGKSSATITSTRRGSLSNSHVVHTGSQQATCSNWLPGNEKNTSHQYKFAHVSQHAEQFRQTAPAGFFKTSFSKVPSLPPLFAVKGLSAKETATGVERVSANSALPCLENKEQKHASQTQKAPVSIPHTIPTPCFPVVTTQHEGVSKEGNNRREANPSESEKSFSLAKSRVEKILRGISIASGGGATLNGRTGGSWRNIEGQRLEGLRK